MATVTWPLTLLLSTDTTDTVVTLYWSITGNAYTTNIAANHPNNTGTTVAVLTLLTLFGVVQF